MILKELDGLSWRRVSTPIYARTEYGVMELTRVFEPRKLVVVGSYHKVLSFSPFFRRQGIMHPLPLILSHLKRKSHYASFQFSVCP